MSALQSLREEATGVLAMLVLGAGLLALFFPGLSPVPFYVVWIVGFAVVLPVFGIPLDDEREPGSEPEPDPEPDREDDPLAGLRGRYAEFARRLGRLLETEDETAAEYVRRERADESGRRERDRYRETAVESEMEGSP
jgi:hypothetical protein